ncbi:MAG: hypothetical protein WA782_05460 [Sulfitobacter sp.]
MTRFLIGLFLMLGGPSLALAAEGYLYECDMQDIARARGWVSPKIAIILPEKGGVTVVDALTLTFATAPLRCGGRCCAIMING